MRGTGPLIPGESLFIHADADASSKLVTDVIESCRLEGIQLWSLRFLVASGRSSNYLHYELPRDVGTICYFHEHPQFEVIRVVEEEMLFWRTIDGEPGRRIASELELGDLTQLASTLPELSDESTWSFSVGEDTRWQKTLEMLALFAASHHEVAYPERVPEELGGDSR